MPQWRPHLCHQISIWQPNPEKQTFTSISWQIPWKWCLTLICKEEAMTHNWAWCYTSFCHQNLRCSLSIIIPGSQEYLPAVANSESVDTIQNSSPQLICVQATRAYLWPKLHLIGGDHPTLQFHPKTARSSEISQNMQEELLFFFHDLNDGQVNVGVIQSLPLHCMQAYLCKKILVEHPIRSSAKLT